MTAARAAILVAALSLAGAAAVALLSRAPAELRATRPPAEEYAAERGARFGDVAVRRARAYRTPAYAAFAIQSLVTVAALAVAAAGPFRRLADWLERVPGGWPVQAALVGAAAAAVVAVALLPVAYVRGYAMEQAWGLSTQSVAGWLSDRAKGLIVSGVVAAIGAAAFVAVVRWRPDTWWLWGWGVFTALAAAAAVVWPVVVAPLFNDFTPLRDERIEARARALATAAGVDVGDILVADASRRTRAENAYVAGLGATKRIVVYDTLLAAGPEETAFVLAHELGHERESHVLKGVATTSAALLAGFAGLAALASFAPGLWAWAGSAGPGDVRALPLLMLYATVTGLLLLPAENAVSRAFERRADDIAVRLTRDPEAAAASFRRLALQNLADLDPPGIAVWALFTHPPVRDRIAAAVEAGRQ